MYLLYLDESGDHGGSPVYVLGGIAAYEDDIYHIQQRLDAMLNTKLPAGFAGIDFELHGAEIKSPTNRKRPSPWGRFDYSLRLDVLRGAYASIADYRCKNRRYPCVLFGAVVDRHYPDYRKRAYEEVLHRFDEMLGRNARHRRGIVIHDESTIEKSLQAWTQRWREFTGRIPGTLGHIVDVPLFADSRASRMIQAADLVTFALLTPWIDRCTALCISLQPSAQASVDAVHARLAYRRKQSEAELPQTETTDKRYRPGLVLMPESPPSLNARLTLRTRIFYTAL